jgi:hypothetical protein
MLNAILHGKRRGLSKDEEAGHVDCTGSEDLLTASVIERLSYLSETSLRSLFFEIFKLSGLDGGGGGQA